MPGFDDVRFRRDQPDIFSIQPQTPESATQHAHYLLALRRKTGSDPSDLPVFNSSFLNPAPLQGPRHVISPHAPIELQAPSSNLQVPQRRKTTHDDIGTARLGTSLFPSLHRSSMPGRHCLSHPGHPARELGFGGKFAVGAEVKK